MSAAATLQVQPAIATLAEDMTRAVVKQILADPIHVLRERGDRNFTLEAARAIFRLDPPLDE
ncbi:MAG: hypothetical protein M0R73_06995 [Dehalococcoidia bacterium]|nr:hypothetical protein [Dehalococcoidia bacterium]